MTYKINVGDKVPFFEGQDQKGTVVSSSALLGHSYVIYFYPKDDTPGCTKEACSIRDQKKQIDLLNARVIGISPDGQVSHEKFITKYNLNFTLLSDEDHSICKAFDVWQPKSFLGIKSMGVERSTFVVDAKGIIRWIERPVKVDKHELRILEALKAL